VTLTPFGLKNAVLNFSGYFCFTSRRSGGAACVGEIHSRRSAMDSQPATRANLFRTLRQRLSEKRPIDFRSSFYTHMGDHAPAFTVFKPTCRPSAEAAEFTMEFDATT